MLGFRDDPADDTRKVRTAALGGSEGNVPVFLPHDKRLAGELRDLHGTDAFSCGVLLGGCGEVLTLRSSVEKKPHSPAGPGDLPTSIGRGGQRRPSLLRRDAKGMACLARTRRWSLAHTLAFVHSEKRRWAVAPDRPNVAERSCCHVHPDVTTNTIAAGTSRSPCRRRPPPCGRDGASGTTRWNNSNDSSGTSRSTISTTTDSLPSQPIEMTPESLPGQQPGSCPPSPRRATPSTAHPHPLH
jgi:hypothetical protein